MSLSLMSLLDAWRRHQRALRDAEALRRLSKVQLADLGIRRDQIDAYVRGRLPAEPPLAPLCLADAARPQRRPVLHVIRGGATRLASEARAATRARPRLAVSNG